MNNIKSNVHWGHSLKYLSFEDKDNKTESQKLIISTIHEWYDAKHRKSSLEEIDFINSLSCKHCKVCGSNKVISNGKYSSGIKRYKCKVCNSSFNPLTKTIFDSKQIPISEWIEYLLHLFEFHSITTSARDNRNAYSTGKYWLIKVFEVLKGIQDDVILKGNIYLDEMFFPVIKRNTVIKDGKKLRGISRNKIGVIVAFDDKDNYLLICTNTSKPSDSSTLKAIGSHIKEGSHLIHDGEKSHNILVERLNLSQKVYKTEDTKNSKDEDNPLDPINNIHALAKRFMKAHGGYNRDNLQDWMNLIWFILSKPDDRYEKTDKFINLAISSPIRVKYRDVMSKKPNN